MILTPLLLAPACSGEQETASVDTGAADASEEFEEEDLASTLDAITREEIETLTLAEIVATASYPVPCNVITCTLTVPSGITIPTGFLSSPS